MLLKVKQAAEILACSPKLVRRLIDSGRLKVIRLGESARSDRIDESDLEEFIYDNKSTRGKCQSIKGAASGISTSRSKTDGLSVLLERERQKKKQKSDK